MEEANFPAPGAEATYLSHKAWTAYFSVVLTTLVVALVAGGGLWYGLHRAGIVAIVVALVLLGGFVRSLAIRSERLYSDAIGVWATQGLLPWSRGVRGIKWRDLDVAAYYPGFWSWLLSSYTLRIGHRYAKDNEIRLTQMANAKQAVTAINEQHQRMLLQGNPNS